MTTTSLAVTWRQPLSPWEQARAEFACSHRVERLTVKTARNGVRHYRVQCLECGSDLHPIPVATLTDARKRTAPPFDEALRRRHSERISARGQQLYEAQR